MEHEVLQSVSKQLFLHAVHRTHLEQRQILSSNLAWGYRDPVKLSYSKQRNSVSPRGVWQNFLLLVFLPLFSKCVSSEEFLPNTTYNQSDQNAIDHWVLQREVCQWRSTRWGRGPRRWKSNHRELQHYWELLWPQGTATRWKVSSLNLSVLCCDVARFVSASATLYFFVCVSVEAL